MLTIRALPRRVLDWLGFGSGPSLPAAPEGPVQVLPSDLVEPLVAPAYGIDGWTYQGTVLEECFPPDVEVELSALIHAVCSGLATTWSYEQAARLLEKQKAYGQAYAVVAAYIESGAVVTGSLLKWRARLADAFLAQAADPPTP
jgi:hypothetical protein